MHPFRPFARAAIERLPSRGHAMAGLAWLLLGLGLLAGAAPPAAAAVDCQPEALSCAVSGTIAASVLQFRAGNRGDAHWAQTTIAFANHGRAPLTLAYRGGSGMLFDDQGNTYEAVRGKVRGIGVAEGSRVDTSFTLQPGESGQAQFEFQWSRQRGEVTGTRFQMSTAVREVSVQAGGTVRLGREHVLRWGGLVDAPPGAAGGGAPAAAAAGMAQAPAAEGATAAAPAVDVCAGRAGCQDLGLFAVEVARLQASPPKGAAHPVRAEFRVRNGSTAPIMLGLVSGSPQLIDENGNRYTVGNTNVHVHGIGMVTRTSANAQFVLEPGQTRGFALDFNGYGNFPVGRRFSAGLALAQLEPLPGAQVRTVREHAISLPDVPTGGLAGLAGPAGGAQGAADLKEAVQGLRELFRKK
jgi:hypothetical protein